MPVHGLSTAKIAKIVGCHPNTVRLYEQWGYIQPAPRSQSGYRLFTPAHIHQMCLARLALQGAWPGKAIRKSALALVRMYAASGLQAALGQAHRHLEVVHTERRHAEKAADLLQHWAQAAPPKHSHRPLRTAETARLLEVTHDALRTWERNNLVNVPRDPYSGYRCYGPPEIARLRVVRMLRSAGYSLAAILRMMLKLERGEKDNLRHALDTPNPGEDVYFAADRWLTTLNAEEERARQLILFLEDRLADDSAGSQVGNQISASEAAPPL